MIIIPLARLALRGVKISQSMPQVLLRRNILIYGIGGIVAPFPGIWIIDQIVHTLGLRSRNTFKQLTPAFRLTLAPTILTGLLYPGLVTALAQLMFPHQARGSLVTHEGKVIGSELIGQTFSKPEYFQPRPSAAGSDAYDGGSSSGSNLTTTSRKLADRVAASVEEFRKNNPDFKRPLLADLITSSGSRLDPDLSPASAEAQASRVAKARGVALDQVNQHAQFIVGLDLGFLGEPRVNVLLLNRELDKRYPAKR